MKRLFSTQFALLIVGLMVAATGLMASVKAEALACYPTSVKEARAHFDQSMAEANMHLQAAYNVAQMDMENRNAQAESRLSIAMTIPKIDPDHSADRMNEIQTQYMQEIQDSKNRYAFEVSAAKGRYDVESVRAVDDYNSALCM